MPVEQMIVTDLPRGKGIDPSRAGWKIKAASPGLDADTRRLLESICEHYGDVVYSGAPQAARDRETSWRKHTDSLDAVPEEILKEFPVIWSYDSLREDLFALTRVCYIGLTHDGRVGNFFAHSIAFPPEALSDHAYNPLALTRTKLFRSKDRSDDTELPALADLGGAAPAGSDGGILSGSPYRDRLADLVSALSTATRSTRPVLVCISDWRKAVRLLEGLLGLIPPEKRCRIAFCTFESDRGWLPAIHEGRPAGLAAAHDIFILCSEEDRSFDLRPDEYQSTFAAFNFAGNRFSDLGAPRAYAMFAAGCLADRRGKRLDQHHEIVQKLSVGQNPDAWDALVPAAAFLDEKPRPEALVEGIQGAAPFATEPPQIQMVLDWLLPHIRSFAGQDNSPALELLAPAVSPLVNRLSSEADKQAGQSFVSEIRSLAASAMAQGKGRTPDALLAICGGLRERVLLGILSDVFLSLGADFPFSSNPKDRKAFLDLLLLALNARETHPEVALPSDRLLAGTFRLAQKAGLTDHAWQSAGESIVEPLFRSAWDEDRQRLACELAEMDDRMRALKQEHELVEKLHLGYDRKVWETLAPAASLLDEAPPADVLAHGIGAVAPHVSDKAQVETVLAWILPHVRTLARQQDPSDLELVSKSLAAIVNKIAPGGPDRIGEGFVSEVQALAENSLSEGRARTASTLLGICGKARERVLLELTEAALPEPEAVLPIPPNRADQQALLSLLLEAVTVAEEQKADERFFTRLLLATFHFAHDVEQVDQVWKGTGRSVVERHLSGEWNPKKEEFTRNLLEHVPAKACPNGNVWLSMKLLEMTRPEGEELISGLVYVSAIVPACDGVKELIRRLLRIVKQFADAAERAVALGRMAEAVQPGAVEEELFSTYRDVVQKGDPNQRETVRQKLAGVGAAKVLCRELLADVLPWDEVKSPKRLQSWRSCALGEAKVMDTLCRQVAGLLTERGRAESVLPLAEQLIPKNKEGLAADSGCMKLCNAVVLTLPLEPLSSKWENKLVPPPAGLSREAQGRLRVLKFMREVSNKVESPDWSPESFPRSQDAWRKDAASLNEDDKNRVLRWAVGTFGNAGVTTPEHAKGLVGLIENVGEKRSDAVVTAVCQLLEGRDRVTSVLTAMAFADCVLQGKEEPERWGDIVRPLLSEFDKKTRRLFEEHLDKRFCRRDEAYMRRLSKLRQSIGLRPPKHAVPTAAAVKNKPREPVTGPAQKGRRIGRSFRRLFRRRKDRVGPGSQDMSE